MATPVSILSPGCRRNLFNRSPKLYVKRIDRDFGALKNDKATYRAHITLKIFHCRSIICLQFQQFH